MFLDDVLVPLRDVGDRAGLAVLADVCLLALLGGLLLGVDPLVVQHVLRHVLVARDLGNLKSKYAKLEDVQGDVMQTV